MVAKASKWHEQIMDKWKKSMTWHHRSFSYNLWPLQIQIYKENEQFTKNIKYNYVKKAYKPNYCSHNYNHNWRRKPSRNVQKALHNYQHGSFTSHVTKSINLINYWSFACFSAGKVTAKSLNLGHRIQNIVRLNKPKIPAIFSKIEEPISLSSWWILFPAKPIYSWSLQWRKAIKNISLTQPTNKKLVPPAWNGISHYMDEILAYK